MSHPIEFVLLNFVHISLHSPVVTKAVGCHPLQTSCLTKHWKTGRRFPTQVQPTASLKQRPAEQVEIECRREGTMSRITVLHPQHSRQRPLEPVTVHRQLQWESLDAALMSHVHARLALPPLRVIKYKIETTNSAFQLEQSSRGGAAVIHGNISAAADQGKVIVLGEDR